MQCITKHWVQTNSDRSRSQQANIQFSSHITPSSHQLTASLTRSQETAILKDLTHLRSAREFHALYIGVNHHTILVIAQELWSSHTIAWKRVDWLIRSYCNNSVICLRHISYRKHTITASTLISVWTIVHLSQRTYVDTWATAAVPVNRIVRTIVFQHLAYYAGVATCTNRTTSIYNQHIHSITGIGCTKTGTWVQLIPEAGLSRLAVNKDLLVVVRTNSLCDIHQFVIKTNLKIQCNLIAHFQFAQLSSHGAMTRQYGVVFIQSHWAHLLFHFGHFGLHDACGVPRLSI